MSKRLPVIFFVHIEKAGGITLHNLLHNNLFTYISPSPEEKFGEVLTASHLKSIMQYMPFKLGGVGGHRVGAFCDYETVIKDRPSFYFTFMRDPIKRYLSHYNWQRFIMGHNWTLDTFVKEPHFNNYQCLRIGGQRDFSEAKKLIEDKFDFIGLMARYDESLVMLKQKLGYSSFDIHYEKSNVKEYKNQDIAVWNDLSSDIQEKIIANNAEDIKLYRYVQDLIFSQQMQEYKGNLINETKAFKNSNENFKFSKYNWFKSKASNVLLKKVIQPIITGNGNK